MEDSSIKTSCSNFILTSMINKPTCYKNPGKPTCIDLILTDCPGSFQNSCVIKTGLSDFYKMIVTVMKTSYRKIEPTVINYRDYKSFSNEVFRKLLLEKLKRKFFGNSDQSFSNFINTCKTVLDKQLPKKKKYVRGNQLPFMNSNYVKNKSYVNYLFHKLRETNKPLCFSSKENEKRVL